MRYFLIVLVAFAACFVPPLRGLAAFESLLAKACFALAMGIFPSGVHHAVYVRHYIDIMPPWVPAKRTQVYVSALLRMAFGIGLLFPATRPAAIVGTLVLLSYVFPVNLRMAITGKPINQLVSARWYLWLRVGVHLSWIGWCVWCLTLQ